MNVVVVVSAIHVSSAPLSYTPTRSAFSAQQRFDQSLETIRSVRQHVPNPYIVFVEGTELAEGYRAAIHSLVDHLHLAGSDAAVRECVAGPYKSLGEVASLLSYLESPHFQWARGERLVASLSKLSGRYRILPAFRFDLPPNDAVLAHITHDNPHHPSHVWMSTMFYTVPGALVDAFVHALQDARHHPELLEGVAVEHVLPHCLKEKGVRILAKAPMHVGGEYGPWGGYVEH